MGNKTLKIGFGAVDFDKSKNSAIMHVCTLEKEGGMDSTWMPRCTLSKDGTVTVRFGSILV